MSADEEPNATEVVRKVVGKRLYQLRKASGLTMEAAGQHIRATKSKISRMESGQRRFYRRDLVDLLNLYGVTNTYEQDTFISVALGERQPSWWDREDLRLDEAVIWRMEQTADLIRSYGPRFVPELLRTPAYAAAAYRASQYPPPPPDIIDRAVTNLTRRQEALQGDGPSLWVVIEEPVLWRPIAGKDAHLAQLDALVEAAQHPKIRIQVNPAASAYIPAYVAFTIFRFTDAPQMIAVHGSVRDDITPRDDDEERAMAFDRLTVAAHRASHTPDLLTQIRDRIHRHL